MFVRPLTLMPDTDCLRVPDSDSPELPSLILRLRLRGSVTTFQTEIQRLHCNISASIYMTFYSRKVVIHLLLFSLLIQGTPLLFSTLLFDIKESKSMTMTIINCHKKALLDVQTLSSWLDPPTCLRGLICRIHASLSKQWCLVLISSPIIYKQWPGPRQLSRNISIDPITGSANNIILST